MTPLGTGIQHLPFAHRRPFDRADGLLSPGKILGAACLIDRSAGKVDLGVPLVALASLAVPSYPADALPPELAAIPAVKPGSRRL